MQGPDEVKSMRPANFKQKAPGIPDQMPVFLRTKIKTGVPANSLPPSSDMRGKAPSQLSALWITSIKQQNFTKEVKQVLENKQHLEEEHSWKIS